MHIKELSNNNFPILLALLSVFCVAYMDNGLGCEQERKLSSKSYITLLCAPCRALNTNIIAAHYPGSYASTTPECEMV
jgi:hypothetical protein